MTKSIMQDEKRCYISRFTDQLERHHVFGGPLRHLSERYGLWVWLRHDWHNEPPYGAHFSVVTRRKLQRAAQIEFQRAYPDLDFVKIFGRNYLI